MKTSTLVPEYMKIRQFVLNRYMSIHEPEKLPAEREMCEMFNVCRGTVRKALSDLTREGYITSRARSGNFIMPTENHFGIQYSRHKFKRVAMIKDRGMNISMGWQSMKMMSGIYRTMSDREVIMENINFSSFDKSIINQLGQLTLDGILWQVNRRSVLDKIKEFLKNNENFPPVMLISFQPETEFENVIYIDYKKAYYHAAEYLFKLGHRDILYVGYNPKIHGCDEELEMLKKAHINHNIPFNRNLIIEECDGIADRFEGMLQTGNLPFTAVICRSLFCEMIYETAAKRGMSIPRDFSLVSERDIFTKRLKKSLTLMSPPLENLGSVAAIKLADIIEKKITSPVRIELECEISEGDSCKKI